MKFLLIFFFVTMSVLFSAMIIGECIYQFICSSPKYYESKKGKKILEILEIIF